MNKWIDIRKGYSDGDIFMLQWDRNEESVSRNIVELDLETTRTFSTRNPGIKSLISLLLGTIQNLRQRIQLLKEDIRSLATQQVYFEDQNTILTKQLNRKQIDIKKLNMQLINTEHQVNHYRQLLSKYNISDASSVERLASTNRELQDELQLQHKRVYDLEQQLYMISKENDHLKMKNKSLYSVVNQPVHPPIKKEKKKSKKECFWWSRFVNSFKKKKTLPQTRQSSLPVLPVLPRFSSSTTDESITSSISSRPGLYPVLKEDIQMLRRASTQSRHSAERWGISVSNSAEKGTPATHLAEKGGISVNNSAEKGGIPETHSSEKGGIPVTHSTEMGKLAVTHSNEKLSLTHSNEKERIIPASHSTTSLPTMKKSSIQQRVSKSRKERTRSEHTSYQDSTVFGDDLRTSNDDINVPVQI